MTGATPLGPGKEFDAIRDLLARWGSAARGIGDDAAVLDVPAGERLVVSTDTSVEHVHFRRGWITADEIGWRATMAALSDLAAMGARPLGLLSALTLPESWRGDLPALGHGVAAATRAAGCAIVGGDTSAGAELSLTITVLGSAVRPLRRGGARPGDTLWVSGALGGPGRALRAMLGGAAPETAARERFARPQARIALGLRLAALGCHAAIDISDGIVADARHMAAASHCALTIDLGALPLLSGVNAAEAAASGEEYELLFAAPSGFDGAALARECGVSLTAVGSVGEGAPAVAVMQGGARVEIAGGHDHFSR